MPKPTDTLQKKLSRLPSVTEVDQYLREQGLPHGKAVRDRVQSVLADARQRLRTGAGAASDDRAQILGAIREAVQAPAPRQLRRVINATGVVVHTNLGRAPLAPGLLEAARPQIEAYTDLEFDLESGRRGERGGRVPELLAALSRAEGAVVVNNNAAAVLLMLSALARRREVIVSRGELVEIGGSFRLPDIMREAGVRLVEVGTTNRTRLRDYADAITPETAALLKVHPSNFHMSGFVEEATVAELVPLAKSANVQVWHDWGSGNFYRFSQPALRHMTTVQQEVEQGPQLLTLSGDKLLGSVQCGIVVGHAAPLERMRRHPLYRSLRVDKVRLAMLERSLLDYLEVERLRSNNPTVDFLERTVAELEPMARRVFDGLRGKVAGLELIHEHSLVGGGALPEVRLETVCLAWRPKGGEAGAFTADALTKALRARELPIVARVQEGRVLFDFRTLFEADLPELAAAIRALG